MDLSPQCHPAQPAPLPGNLLSPGTLSFSLPSSQLRAGRAGHAGLSGCLSSPTNDLGPAWNSLAGIQTAQPGSPGLSILLPHESRGVNLHLGQFQIKLDSWELLLGDPEPPMGLQLPSYTVSFPRNPPQGVV